MITERFWTTYIILESTVLPDFTKREFTLSLDSALLEPVDSDIPVTDDTSTGTNASA